MGLDSVALLMEFEEYFGIEIPNRVAEKIVTVHNVVNEIALIKNVKEEGTALRDEIFTKLVHAIHAAVPGSHSITLSDAITKIFPGNHKEQWEHLSARLKLEVPAPPLPPQNVFERVVVNRITGAAPVNYKLLNFGDLTDVICAANIDKFIDKSNITTKYHIYISLMSLTVDTIGINWYEFKPEKSFTNDFGID